MKRTLVKKLIATMVAGTMAVSMLAGCGGASDEKNDPAVTQDDASGDDASGDDASGDDASGDDASGGAADASGVDTTEAQAVADVGYEGEPVV